MSKKAEILQSLRRAIAPSELQVFPVTVMSVEGNTCTVEFDTGLEVDGVRLKATPDDADGSLVLRPKVGSQVLVGVVNTDIADLYVAQCDKVDAILYKYGNNVLEVSENLVHLKCDGLQIKLNKSSGKVEIFNAQVSLKNIFTELISTLNAFKVVTAQGTSVSLDPITVANVAAIQTKVNQLL